ncbi:MAG: hypothetical protein WDN72_04660 [Alphaproteobacteria bacterium]
MKRPGVGPWFWVLTGVGIGVSFIPLFGGGLSYLVDRVKYGKQASDELEFRAKFYRHQIAGQLGIHPDHVNAHDFKLAAQANPMLGEAYREVIRKKNSNDRESAMVNTGVTAASFIGVGGIVKAAADGMTGAKILGGAAEMAAVTTGGIGGGAISGLFTKDHVSTQEIVEAMRKDVDTADANGGDTGHAVKPQTIFALRVAQDDALAERIRKENNGTPFHKLNEAQQLRVMSALPALANSATTEASAIRMKLTTPEDLAASKPNLDGLAAKYAVGQKNSSFMQRIDNERARQAVATSAPAI